MDLQAVKRIVQESGNIVFFGGVGTSTESGAAHLGLAELERQGKLKAVITQNIDGLHQQAGSKEVLELHGSVHRNFCMGCGEIISDSIGNVMQSLLS